MWLQRANNAGVVILSKAKDLKILMDLSLAKRFFVALRMTETRKM